MAATHANDRTHLENDMADYRLQFATSIPFPAHAKAEVDAWVAAQQALSAEKEIDDEAFIDFGIQVSERDLWVLSNDDGSVERAATLIQQFMRAFHITGAVLITYACTCSKPREHGFFGGAALITSTDVQWQSPEQLVNAARLSKIDVINFQPLDSQTEQR